MQSQFESESQIECQSQITVTERKIYYEKIRIVSIFIICLFVLCSCGKDISKPQKSTSGTEKNADDTKFVVPTYTDFSTHNDINAHSGLYIFETEKYVFYRNNADNGYLYRLNKETNAKKVIFNKNTNFFIHSIKAIDTLLYFVTRTETDEVPALYSCDFEGNNITKIIENVGDCYIVSGNTIYYTSYRETNGDIFYIHKYSLDSKSDNVIYATESWDLNLVEDYLYFAEVGFTENIVKLNVKTNESQKIPLPDGYNGVGDLRYSNESLYFNTGIKIDGAKKATSSIVKYDLKKAEFQSLFDDKSVERTDHSIYIGDFIINPDESLFVLLTISDDTSPTPESTNEIWHIKDGNFNLCKKINRSGLLHYCDGEFLIFDFNSSSDALIAGNDKYNEVIS